MRPHLFSIPPGISFSKTLAASLLEGRLIEGWRHDGDPLALSDVLIYVPTRRAARSLAGSFQQLLGGASAILPQIRPIGEGDEAEILAARNATPVLEPVMGELERRLRLGQLTRRWRTMTREAELTALIGEDVVLPASAADALALARDLGALLDEIETEDVTISALAGLAPEALAEWWRLTLTFLTIVTEHWPAVLCEQDCISEARAQNLWLEAEADRLTRSPPNGPVILAGSTATAPKTIALMRVIAHLVKGAVVLPGLDTHLDEESFSKIDRERAFAAPGHHQYGLKRILEGLLAGRDAVTALGMTEAGLAARERFLSDALRPAETTDRWGSSASAHPSNALEGIALVEAADPREEALAIACAMRTALSDPNASCALITPDRNLARRVVVELARFGITANDSAGRPLGATAPGTLLSTLLSVAFEPGDPIALIALLKHPLTRLGLPAGEARNAARTIELLVLRGTVDIADGARLSAMVEARLGEIRKARSGEATAIHLARPVRLVSDEALERAIDFAARFDKAIASLIALRGDTERELSDYASVLIRSLEAFACNEERDTRELYAEEPGRVMKDFLANLAAAPKTGFGFPSGELGDVADTLMADATVRPRGGLSNRAFVWGTLEARLQSVDTAILGGLNEATWPPNAKTGAFLSRRMRRDLTLDPPERRIGLSAHDFWMAMGAKTVVMTRSRRMDGAPTIASRWLQRVLALAGDERGSELRRRGEVFIEAARRLERAETMPPAERPRPKPPVEKRPTRYSVTEVETLIRDPYTIHAARIMNLEPLPPLMRAPNVAERGSLYHAILSDFITGGHDPAAPNAQNILIEIARGLFAEADLPPEIETLWWPRLETMVAGYLDWERARHGSVASRAAEISGGLDLAEIETRLTARADRIDRLKDGALHIVDFKTGATPSVKQARILLAPQLALEGGIARRGGFADTKAGETIADLAFLRLKEREVVEEGLATGGTKSEDPVDPGELSDQAIDKFIGLAALFRREEHPFASRTRPAYVGDFSGTYDHLSRAREWVIAGGEDEGGEE
ncbi:MAG: double-strand break repair protein AddB [Pseudomonadota bacterium]|nr:double-strand break repair protein AddB [Pseudomonadota bacterium]